MRVIVEYEVHRPYPASDADYEDIFGTMQAAGDSVGLEMLSATYDPVDDAAHE